MQRPPLPPGDIPGTYLFQRLSRPQGHSADGGITSMKYLFHPIGIRACIVTEC